MSSAPVVRWSRALQLTVYTAGQLAVDTARRVLPRPVRYRLARFAPFAEAILDPSTRLHFDKRPIALADCRPLLQAAEFADGPIVLVNNGLAAGGVERQVVNTLRGLEQRNLNARMLCLRLHEMPELDFFLPALAGFPGFIRNIMPIEQARAQLAAQFPEASLARVQAALTWLPRDIRDLTLRFAAEFARVKPAVVHAWQDSTNIATAYAAWLVGVPRILVSTRNLAPTNFVFFRAYMLHGYRELAACKSVVMINNSEAGARDYARWLEIPSARFVVKRNGIDTRAIRRPAPQATAALRAKLAVPDGAKIIGSIFRLYAEKQPVLWIETAARISRQFPDCHFVIFGEGPLLRNVMRAARRHGIADRLHTPGNIADSALGLSLFDLFLLTSKVEGTPNVVLEASLLGIPVVCTDAGGTREAVAQGATGLVAATDDADGLAQHVAAILQDPAWAERARTEGPAFVERRFGLGRMLDETVAFYQDSPAP